MVVWVWVWGIEREIVTQLRNHIGKKKNVFIRTLETLIEQSQVLQTKMSGQKKNCLEKTQQTEGKRLTALCAHLCGVIMRVRIAEKIKEKLKDFVTKMLEQYPPIGSSDREESYGVEFHDFFSKREEDRMDPKYRSVGDSLRYIFLWTMALSHFTEIELPFDMVRCSSVVPTPFSNSFLPGIRRRVQSFPEEGPHPLLDRESGETQPP